jgi:hypothetical protein
MARRTSGVVDIIEILVHWHAGRNNSEIAASPNTLTTRGNLAYWRGAGRRRRRGRRTAHRLPAGTGRALSVETFGFVPREAVEKLLDLARWPGHGLGNGYPVVSLVVTTACKLQEYCGEDLITRRDR